MVDFYFIEFYIKMKYDMKMENYFNVFKSIVSGWRNKKFPDARIHEFCFRENSNDIFELFERIYKR